MPLTTLHLEIEIDDTFQNGEKVDLQTLYEVINETASSEYERQVQANRIPFKMSLITNPAVDVDVLELDQVVAEDTQATSMMDSAED
jgi:hypothetical protein